MRQCDRGFGRQTDRVRQPPIALEALGQLRDRLRMDEQHRAEFLSLGPDGMEFRVRKLFAGYAAATRGAARPLLVHRGLKLRYCQVGKLQGQRAKGSEAVRLRGTKLGHLAFCTLTISA